MCECVCVRRENVSIDHAMICKRAGFITQRHNEVLDLEADLLNMVCNDVQTEPVLQNISGEQLSREPNTAPVPRLDIHARGFWENQRLVRVCHRNATSYRPSSPNRFTKCMKTRRNDYTQEEFLMSSLEYLPHNRQNG